MTLRADCHLALTHVGPVPCLVVSGALRSSLTGALAGRRFPTTGRRLIVDLRAVEVVDSVGARALAGFLPPDRAACILPGAWCAGRRLLTQALQAFPLHASPAELSETAALAASSPGVPRRHLRKAARVPARMLSLEGDQPVTLLDVSLGGALLECSREPAARRPAPLPGERIQLDLAGSRLAARIVRIGLPDRLGIAFSRTRRALPRLAG